MPDEMELIHYYPRQGQAHLNCLTERLMHIHRYSSNLLRLKKTVQIFFYLLFPLPLYHLRGRGQLVELGAPDLRFTADEATAFLN